MEKIDAVSIANFIKDITLQLGFDRKKLQGQYYDSCAPMNGEKERSCYADGKWHSTPCTFYQLPHTLAKLVCGAVFSIWYCAIACAHASTYATSLMHVKNSMHHLGLWHLLPGTL